MESRNSWRTFEKEENCFTARGLCHCVFRRWLGHCRQGLGLLTSTFDLCTWGCHHSSLLKALLKIYPFGMWCDGLNLQWGLCQFRCYVGEYFPCFSPLTWPGGGNSGRLIVRSNYSTFSSINLFFLLSTCLFSSILLHLNHFKISIFSL